MISSSLILSYNTKVMIMMMIPTHMFVCIVFICLFVYWMHCYLINHLIFARLVDEEIYWMTEGSKYLLISVCIEDETINAYERYLYYYSNKNAFQKKGNDFEEFMSNI